MEYYTPDAIDSILKSFSPDWVRKEKVYYANTPVSFDIETSSTYIEEDKKKKKFAFMYVWMLDIDDKTIIGRTWKEFQYVMNRISQHFGLSGVLTLGMQKRMIVYVHSLAYEFQFIRKLFKFTKVFSLKKRKPLYAVTDTGIEFRCSYRLTGYKLEKIGEQMGIEKLPDFNYRLIRHSRTPLTPREIMYCIHDVKIVSELIRRKSAEEKNGLATIPLTKTGYVRRYVREKTLKGTNRCFYIEAIKNMTLSPQEYLIAKDAFAGGFTHAGFRTAGKKVYDVKSFDFSSSYPTVLIAEKYPMAKGKRIEGMTRQEFLDHIHNHDCCVFTIELTDVQQIFPIESYISESRCSTLEGELAGHDEKGRPIWKPKSLIINNGRVYRAKRIVTTITSVDYEIIEKVYDFNLERFGNFYIYESQYLPTEFVKCILEFYNIKTQLKDIQGKETEYMNGKENLNALFGMCVTDIVREIIPYEDDWVDIPKKTEQELMEWIERQINRENTKVTRFLFYLWGVFCTAYARRNLWTGIFECKTDYLYSDTDSVKITNAEDHQEYFDNYNKWITKRLEAALDYHNLPHEWLRPMNKKGVEKPLGIWDFDGEYKEFKAIRAKAYAYISKKPDKEGKTFHITIAGLSKKEGAEYLQERADKSGLSPIDLFTEDMKIPADRTGKLTHSYIDEPRSAMIEDYKGNRCGVFEYSSVHLEPCEFHLSLAQAYINFLKGYTEQYD